MSNKRPLKRWLCTAVLALTATGLASCDADDTPPEPKADAAQVEAPVPLVAAAADATPAREERSPADTGPEVEAPAEAPPVLGSVEEPPAPTKLLLLIDDRLVEFPAARIHLTRTRNGVSARLYSDDPDEAIGQDYVGNSFYLQMPLEVDDPQRVDQCYWTYKAPDSEKSRKPDGIYLDGTRTHLQPFDVEALFEGTPPRVTVTVSGQFLTFDSPDAPGMPRFVSVWGRLPATVDEEEEG